MMDNHLAGQKGMKNGHKRRKTNHGSFDFVLLGWVGVESFFNLSLASPFLDKTPFNTELASLWIFQDTAMMI